ncbi:hypothetical protein FACS1894111_12770 [Clostridia bacterium]|nr:hypothetical protein FACS1894111_12770 [Clostridia bacterium]
MKKRIKLTPAIAFLFLFAVAFFAGIALEKAKTAGSGNVVQLAGGDWGLSFREEGKPPVADTSAQELAKYDAYYIEDTTGC